MAETIKVTLIKSMIGRPEKHRRVLRSMGLTRLNRSRIFQNSPSIRGQIFKISHLVATEEK
jgi:large subunit ribosomal protein L30